MKLPKATRLDELAAIISARVVGDGALMVSGINEIHKVQPGDLTFVDVPKYYDKALKSEATFILIDKEVDCPEGKALLVSKEPFRDYNRLVRHFTQEVSFHQDDFSRGRNVKIGPGTRIHPGVVIADDVEIGQDCEIFPNVVIYENSILGDNVVIHAGTVIGSHAFYYKNFGDHYERMLSCGRTLIGDRVEIGAGCTIDKGVSGDTVIGKDCILDNHIHLGHGVVLGQRCLLAGQVGIGGKTILGDEVMIWGQVGIVKDITIGDRAVILSGAGVSKPLKGDTVYFGAPAEEAKKKYRELAATRMLPELIKKLK